MTQAPFFRRDEYFMRLALREAEQALEHDDVPVGCVIVADGEVVAAAHNERELRGDPTAHAEVLALREASGKLGGWRLDGAVLYVTLEPCAMCAGAIVLARVPRVIFATSTPRPGRRAACSTCWASPGSTTARWSPAACSPRRLRTCCAPSSRPVAELPAATGQPRPRDSDQAEGVDPDRRGRRERPAPRA